MATFQIPEEKIKICKKLFKLFDEDGDGKIPNEELGKLMKKYGSDTSTDEISEILKFVDEDKSGSLELEEFLKVFEKKLLENDLFDDIYDAFKIFDYNCKGSFNDFELEKIMTEYGFKMSKEEYNEFSSFASRNENGEIDYEKFAKFLSEKVTPQEIEQLKNKDRYIGFDNNNKNKEKKKNFDDKNNSDSSSKGS